MKFTPLAGIETAVLVEYEQLAENEIHTPSGDWNITKLNLPTCPRQWNSHPLRGLKHLTVSISHRWLCWWNSHPLRGLKQETSFTLALIRSSMKFTPLAGIETQHRRLYRIVLGNEIHTPCGDWNPLMAIVAPCVLNEIHTPCGDWNTAAKQISGVCLWWNSHPLRGSSLFGLFMLYANSW